MLKTVIIDDEIASIESLEIFLHSLDINIDIVGKASNITDAEKIILKKNPDLVFLDIEMPNGNGFDLLDKLENINFHIVFITAFNQYAIKAFKYSAVDYLLKPIDISNLHDAIIRVKHIQEKYLGAKFSVLKDNLSTNIPEKLALPTSESIEVVETRNIIQFEADGNYTTVRIKSKEPVIVSKSLGEFEDILEGNSFFRSHKSHLVNLKHINRILKHKNLIIMDDETHAIISRRRKQEFLDVFQEHLKNKQ
jgi:two-component system LytT family response regulator